MRLPAFAVILTSCVCVLRDRVAELEPVIQNRQSMTPQKKPAKRQHASLTAEIKTTQRQAQTKAMKRKYDPARAQKKPSKRQHASATPPKISLQKKLAKNPLASAVPQKKPARSQHATASSKKKIASRSHVARIERPSQRNSVKRARRAHVNRSTFESGSGSEDQNDGLKVEESDNSSANGRRTRRKSRPPRRFIEIQESLMEGKASKTLKGARTKP